MKVIMIMINQEAGNRTAMMAQLRARYTCSSRDKPRTLTRIRLTIITWDMSRDMVNFVTFFDIVVVTKSIKNLRLTMFSSFYAHRTFEVC